VLSLGVPASMYGGVPATINIIGGRPPYTLISGEPSVLPLPNQTTDQTLTVLPANPGIIDTGLPPDSLPVRTVNITVRDASGITATASTKVGQNFLTAYGMSFGSTTCVAAAGSTATAVTPCSGGDTTVNFQAVFNGNLYGGREFRIDVLQGPMTLINPATGASGQSIGVTSDHLGDVSAIVRVPANTVTQVGTLRVTDVASGTSHTQSFIIAGGTSATTLTAVPSAFTFTGPDNATCGTGTGQFFVFDGTPPYTAVSGDNNVSITFIDPNHNPGRFQINANNPNTCVTNGTIVVTDAANAHTTVTVTTAKGTTPPVVPPAPLQVQPTSLTLGCAQSGQALAIGGVGSGSSSGGSGGSGGSSASYSAASSSPNVTATVSGNQISITRLGPAGPGTGGTTNYTVNVTDGSSIVPITVTAPVTCP
jgi:hypothetical protein